MTRCIQCGEIPKYKCPTCLQPYCSVLCCKEHKLNPCSAPSKPEVCASKPSLSYEFPTEDTVAPEKLELLRNSTELKKCLENPHVRTILELLDKSPHPDELIQKYMQEPIFTEFVDICLNTVAPAEDIDKL
ncbi:zinc finger HIT domain-containing protein 3 [Galleria mellonella]|uniref:Zinc finger HIT domain-containing protein 3 n=1 Tax=Galleria mellonella TaxID=7137 RepID=A0A6J1WZH6_GALME|nr:zinc finger HIT domain-containing protein 3 [Galleria mellonella]